MRADWLSLRSFLDQSLRTPDAQRAYETLRKCDPGLARFVEGQKESIKRCYLEPLQKDPMLKGKIVVLFTITPDGLATHLSIAEDTFPRREVAMCVMQVVRQWVFPFRPATEVSVAYPFFFAP